MDQECVICSTSYLLQITLSTIAVFVLIAAVMKVLEFLGWMRTTEHSSRHLGVQPEMKDPPPTYQEVALTIKEEFVSPELSGSCDRPDLETPPPTYLDATSKFAWSCLEV